jgi:hypothetical protein
MSTCITVNVQGRAYGRHSCECPERTYGTAHPGFEINSRILVISTVSITLILHYLCSLFKLVQKRGGSGGSYSSPATGPRSSSRFHLSGGNRRGKCAAPAVAALMPAPMLVSTRPAPGPPPVAVHRRRTWARALKTPKCRARPTRL